MTLPTAPGRVAGQAPAARPGRNRTAMSETYITEHEVQRAGELDSWTCRERLRFLWDRLRLTVQEMNYAVRRMTELQMRLP
jgi:hypothetical protein